MPSMPEPEMYEVHEDDDGTYSVVWASTGTVVDLNGVLQSGYDIQDADDIADHLEALGRITASRATGKMDS